MSLAISPFGIFYSEFLQIRKVKKTVNYGKASNLTVSSESINYVSTLLYQVLRVLESKNPVDIEMLHILAAPIWDAEYKKSVAEILKAEEKEKRKLSGRTGSLSQSELGQVSMKSAMQKFQAIMQLLGRKSILPVEEMEMDLDV